MAMTPDELIDTSMMLIVHSGDARAAAFHALQEAKAGNYEEAKKLMAESQERRFTTLWQAPSWWWAWGRRVLRPCPRT